MISNNQVSFCVDTLLVEAILADSKFNKKAALVSDLLDKVKSYFGAHIDQSNPVSSVLNVLAPGALWALFSNIGLGKWGFLLGLLMDVFHVNVSGMLNSLYEKVKEMLGDGKKISSAQVDQAAQSTVQEFSKPGTKDEAEKAYPIYQQKEKDISLSDDKVSYSSLDLLADAKLFNLALVDYEHQKMRLTKEADFGSFLGGYNRTKAKGTSLLGTIFGWIIKLALASAGLMVAGDIVNKVMGRPNALDGTYQAGKESAEPAAEPAAHTSTQTKYPLKSDSSLPSSWPAVNNPQNIENMLIQFAKDTYSGLDGKENLIKSSPSFQAVKEDIAWFNIHNPNSAAIFLPKYFSSKKQLVDYFIDDVASRDK